MTYYNNSTYCIKYIDYFYKDLNVDNLNSIENDRISILRNSGLVLYEKVFKNENICLPKFIKYTKIMNKLNSTPKEYNILNKEEMYLLFMFAVDPDLNAFVIHSVANRKPKLKHDMEKEFGVYDANLVRIEKFYISNFMKEDNKKVLYKKIDGMIWK